MINPDPSHATIALIASSFAMETRAFRDHAKEFPAYAENSASGIAKIQSAVKDLGIEEEYQHKLSLWVQ